MLVGKTVEQSLLEVMEEEELANLRMQQCQFEELRNAELVEQQRLEEQERRHREEKVSGAWGRRRREGIDRGRWWGGWVWGLVGGGALSRLAGLSQCAGLSCLAMFGWWAEKIGGA